MRSIPCGLASLLLFLAFSEVSAQELNDRISVSCLLYDATLLPWTKADRGFTPLAKGYDTLEAIWGNFLRVSDDRVESKKNIQIWAERKFQVPGVRPIERQEHSLQVGYYQQQELVYVALLDRQALFASKSFGRNPKSLSVTLKTAGRPNVSAECFFTYPKEEHSAQDFSPEEKPYLSIDPDEQDLYTPENLRARGSVRASCSLVDKNVQEQEQLVSEVYPRVLENQSHGDAQEWDSRPFSVQGRGFRFCLGYRQSENRIFIQIREEDREFLRTQEEYWKFRQSQGADLSLAQTQQTPLGNAASATGVDPRVLHVDHWQGDLELFVRCEFDYLD